MNLVRRRAWLAAVAVLVAACAPTSDVLKTGSAGEPAPKVSVRFARLSFRHASGWRIERTASSLNALAGAPQTWASNVPFAPFDRRPGLAQFFPTGYPSHTVNHLPASGIVIVANVELKTLNPLPSTSRFRVLTLPLRLGPVGPYETCGGPIRGLGLAGVTGNVNGWDLEVSAVFGTRHPSLRLRLQAQRELDRLVVPHAPLPTSMLDEFGVRMELPDGWRGRLFQWPGGEGPILQAATTPLGGDLYNEAKVASSLGPSQALILLAEQFGSSLHFPQAKLPITIGALDLYHGPILGDRRPSSRAPTVLHRSFAVGPRWFDLYVEFGSTPLSASAIAQVNTILATLAIDPSVDTLSSPA